MSRAHSWAELKAMTKAELVGEHDRHTQVASDYLITIRDELRHREGAKQTWVMLWMTVVITTATIANVILWALE